MFDFEAWLREQGFTLSEPVGESVVYIRAPIRVSITRLPGASPITHLGLIGQPRYSFPYQDLPATADLAAVYLHALEAEASQSLSP